MRCLKNPASEKIEDFIFSSHENKGCICIRACNYGCRCPIFYFFLNLFIYFADKLNINIDALCSACLK